MAGDDSGWSKYIDPALSVSLQYPSGWQPRPTNPRRFEGTDGFFQLEASDGGQIDAVAASHADHTLRPFGSQPSITELVVDGQDARLIMPSDDQPSAMQRFAEVLVQAPGLIRVGRETYSYLTLWADIDHVHAIAETVHFEETGTASP